LGLGAILILALALAADAFGVGASIGLVHCRPRQIFRLSWHFGLFQALMPALGALAGSLLQRVVSTYAPYVAAVLLAAIGAKMLWESRRPAECRDDVDPTRGWSLIGLSVAVSIDAFLAGISLAMLHAPLLTACLIIGLVTGLITWLAMLNSRLLRRLLGVWAERVGGVVLLALAVKALFS
jgi:putative Mn2+ efflux pump MntP